MIATTSVYGESLLSFPEQFQLFKYFGMTPNLNDGYTVDPTTNYPGNDSNSNVVIKGSVPFGNYLGIFQNFESSVKDSMGNLINYSKYHLWCEEVLDAGKFVFWNNTTYRIVSSNDWPIYSGFTQYELERMVGSDGQGSIDSGLDDGSGSFV